MHDVYRVCASPPSEDLHKGSLGSVTCIDLDELVLCCWILFISILLHSFFLVLASLCRRLSGIESCLMGLPAYPRVRGTSPPPLLIGEPHMDIVTTEASHRSKLTIIIHVVYLEEHHILFFPTHATQHLLHRRLHRLGSTDQYHLLSSLPRPNLLF